MLTPLVSHSEFDHLHAQVSHRSNRTRIARCYGPGTHRSSFLGQGLETVDSRPYQAGDDIRHMDWRATARSGKPTSKVFMDERQHNLFLIIDRRAGMYFGTRNMLKVTAAIKTAAILAFSAIVNHDMVGGIVVDQQRHTTYPATRDLNATLALLSAAAAAATIQTNAVTPANKTLDHAFSAVLSAAPSNTTLCLISDCDFIADSTNSQNLVTLINKYPVQVFQINDPAEYKLDNVGKIRIASPNGSDIITIDTSNKQIRDSYAAQALEHQKTIRTQLLKWGCTHHSIQTNRNILQQLEALI